MNGEGQLQYITTKDGVKLSTWHWPAMGQRKGRVILIHGFSQNVRTWLNSKRSFPAFLSWYGFEVYAVELRGAGASRRAGAPLPRGFEDYLNWDLPAVWNSLLTEPSVVIGHSMGGLWALYSALFRREMVLGAAAWASPRRLIFPRPLQWAEDYVERLEPMMWLSQVSRFPFPFPVLGTVASRMIQNGMVGIMDHDAMPFTWGSMPPEEVAEHYDQGFDPVSMGQALQLVHWHRRDRFAVKGVTDDLHKDLAEVRTPVLVVSSAADKVVLNGTAMAAVDVPNAPVMGLDGEDLGHLDIVLAPKAERILWPEIVRWTEACCEGVSHSSVAVGR